MYRIPENLQQLRERPTYVQAQDKLLREMRKHPPTITSGNPWRALLWKAARPDLVVGLIAAEEPMRLLPALIGEVELKDKGPSREERIPFSSDLLKILDPKERIAFTQASCSATLRHLLAQRAALAGYDIDGHIALQDLESRLEERYQTWMEACVSALMT